MSAEHRRPLLAFVVVSILCAVMLGQGIRSHAMIGPLGIPRPVSAASDGTATAHDSLPSLAPITIRPSSPETTAKPRRAPATTATTKAKDNVPSTAAASPAAATSQAAAASVPAPEATQSPLPVHLPASAATPPAPAQVALTASVPTTPAKPGRASDGAEQVSVVVVRDQALDAERAAEAGNRAGRDAERTRAAAATAPEKQGEETVGGAAEKAAEDAARMQEAAADASGVLARAAVHDEGLLSEGKLKDSGSPEPDESVSLSLGSSEAP